LFLGGDYRVARKDGPTYNGTVPCLKEYLSGKKVFNERKRTIYHEWEAECKEFIKNRRVYSKVLFRKKETSSFEKCSTVDGTLLSKEARRSGGRARSAAGGRPEVLHPFSGLN